MSKCNDGNINVFKTVLTKNMETKFAKTKLGCLFKLRGSCGDEALLKAQDSDSRPQGKAVFPAFSHHDFQPGGVLGGARCPFTLYMLLHVTPVYSWETLPSPDPHSTRLHR